jgi:hypothetical protein
VVRSPARSTVWICTASERVCTKRRRFSGTSE